MVSSTCAEKTSIAEITHDLPGVSTARRLLKIVKIVESGTLWRLKLSSFGKLYETIGEHLAKIGNIRQHLMHLGQKSVEKIDNVLRKH